MTETVQLDHCVDNIFCHHFINTQSEQKETLYFKDKKTTKVINNVYLSLIFNNIFEFGIYMSNKLFVL